MRIKSLTKLHRQYEIVNLVRSVGDESQDIPIKVFSLPLGYMRNYERMVPMPQPPKRLIINKQLGNKHEENTSDPAYLDQMDEYTDLRQTYLLWCALSPDSECEFANTPEDIETLREVSKELIEFGLTEGDKFAIVTAAMRASGMTEELLNKAKDGF